MDFSKDPHRRYNVLEDTWVKVSPHRNLRPWQGQVEKTADENKPKHDPNCYLCPGNSRSNGDKNPNYTETYAFVNDFSALLANSPTTSYQDGLLKAEGESGICKVICFSPRHDLSVAQMSLAEVNNITKLWKKEYMELASNPEINHVQIFENKGAVMGCSNPHPHGQIWGEYRIPVLPMKEIENQTAYFKQHNKPMLLNYVMQELKVAERIVFETKYFVALVPFWAAWPFEAMILPKIVLSSLADMNDEILTDLAMCTREMAIRYDNVFQTSFPYSMGLHQLPTDGNTYNGLQFHIHYYPPLLRSSTVKKFMVGYEMLGMAQRDITAESAAEKLRSMSNVRFS